MIMRMGDGSVLVFFGEEEGNLKMDESGELKSEITKS